jgi:hypothetical protein
MATGLHDPAVLHHDHEVRLLGVDQAVGDDERGATLRHGGDRPVQRPLAPGLRRRLVQDDDGGIREQHPREGELLDACLVQGARGRCVQVLRPKGADGRERRAQLLVGGRRPREAQVLGHGAGEQMGLLRHQQHGGAAA